MLLKEPFSSIPENNFKNFQIRLKGFLMDLLYTLKTAESVRVSVSGSKEAS